MTTSVLLVDTTNRLNLKVYRTIEKEQRLKIGKMIASNENKKERRQKKTEVFSADFDIFDNFTSVYWCAVQLYGRPHRIIPLTEILP